MLWERSQMSVRQWTRVPCTCPQSTKGCQVKEVPYFPSGAPEGKTGGYFLTKWFWRPVCAEPSGEGEWFRSGKLSRRWRCDCGCQLWGNSFKLREEKTSESRRGHVSGLVPFAGGVMYSLYSIMVLKGQCSWLGIHSCIPTIILFTPSTSDWHGKNPSTSNRITSTEALNVERF